MINAAKAMALTVADLLSDGSLLLQAATEFAGGIDLPPKQG